VLRPQINDEIPSACGGSFVLLSVTGGQYGPREGRDRKAAQLPFIAGSWGLFVLLTGHCVMNIHKRILEWQAAHPNITWNRLGHRVGNRPDNPVLAAEVRIGRDTFGEF
jgi:hypothetical protein